MPFPEIADVDFSSKGHENQQMREALDYAIIQWSSRRGRHQKMEALYDAHNGLVNQKEIDVIINKTGKRSKTKYVKYRLGRAKIKQLHGEFLEITIEPTVTTINRDAQNERMQKYKSMYGMALAKPYIEKVRTLGYDVFSGIKIPDKDDKSFWTLNNFKLTNEMAMQTIINDKMTTQKLKTKYFYNFIDLTVVSELFGKVERNADGIDTYRYIPAKYAMYQESVFDPILERTPYMGEVRYMYLHEILSNPEFDLTETQKKELKKYAKDYTIDDSSRNTAPEKIDGHSAFPVYTLQWKGLEKIIRKTSPAKDSLIPYKLILSEDYYNTNKKKIENDVKKGKYEIDIFYREIVWTASRINTTIYTPAKKEKYIIQRLNENGKMKAEFDYCGMLFTTVNGQRVSMQEIIYELEKIYDDIRFQINKEIRKIKGNLMTYDDAFLPKGKQFIDVYHSIDEDGLIRYNSAAEGNRYGVEIESNKVGIDAVNLGDNQNIVVLMQQAMDIERVMDRVTGMNENRQGLTKATTTATANVNNIEASRSMTYDLFYFMSDFIERSLMKLAEKTKLNKTYYGQDPRMFVFDDKEIKYLVATRGLMQDNYAVALTDGRKEQNILQKLEQLFPAEINAGLLRTKDVARFFMESSFASALKVLDEASEELKKVRQKEMEAQQMAKREETQSRMKTAVDDREDKQQHDRDMTVLKGEVDKEKILLSESVKGVQDAQKQESEMVQENQDIGNY